MDGLLQCATWSIPPQPIPASHHNRFFHDQFRTVPALAEVRRTMHFLTFLSALSTSFGSPVGSGSEFRLQVASREPCVATCRHIARRLAPSSRSASTAL